jgi:hypothetical protein
MGTLDVWHGAARRCSSVTATGGMPFHDFKLCRLEETVQNALEGRLLSAKVSCATSEADHTSPD